MRFSFLNKIIFCFALFFLINENNFLFAQNIPNNFQSFLDSYKVAKNAPSISAGISVNGKIYWLGSSGFSDIENQVQSTPKTVYRIASISKSITAVALMQLAEKGLVNIDSDIRKYIPFFPAKKWKITARQILNHTSGIRTYKEGEFDSKIYFASIKETIDLIKNDTLKFEPSTSYLYSSLSFNLLAAIIENVSKLSFEDYLQKNIFEPAGMTSTYLEFYNKIISNRARGYIKNKFRIIENAPLADLTIKPAGGGIISTVEDLLKFSISLLEGKLIKFETLNSMLVNVKLKNGTELNYGLGFTLGIDNKGRKFFSHSGTGTGFTSNLIFYPEEKITSVHLINIRDRDLDNPAQSLIYGYLDNLLLHPKKSLYEELIHLTIRTNIDSALTFYKAVKKDSLKNYIISKDELKILGYNFLSLNKTNEAILIFKTLISDYPDFLDAFIGLGDTYRNDNNIGLALKSYKQALNIDPKNSYCLKNIRQLEKKIKKNKL